MRFEWVLTRLVREVGERDLVLVSHGAFIAMGLTYLCENAEAIRLIHCSVAEVDTVAASGLSLGRFRVLNAPELAAQPERAADR